MKVIDIYNKQDRADQGEIPEEHSMWHSVTLNKKPLRLRLILFLYSLQRSSSRMGPRKIPVGHGVDQEGAHPYSYPTVAWMLLTGVKLSWTWWGLTRPKERRSRPSRNTSKHSVSNTWSTVITLALFYKCTTCHVI